MDGGKHRILRAHVRSPWRGIQPQRVLSGRPPDDIVQVETRQLYWPPTRDKRQLWVFRYRYDKEDGEADEGLGMVGSITWAMFNSNTAELSPEDVYGLPVRGS